MIYVMYNPLAGNKTCEESCKGVSEIFSSDELSYIDLLTVDDLEERIRKLAPEDQIITGETIIWSVRTPRPSGTRPGKIPIGTTGTPAIAAARAVAAAGTRASCPGSGPSVIRSCAFTSSP